MEKAIINTKSGKAARLPDVPIELVQVLGEGIKPIFQKKGDVLECGDRLLLAIVIVIIIIIILIIIITNLFKANI